MELCRACLCSDPYLLNIHKTECDSMFTECTSLEIDIKDDLPHGICVSCYNVLNHFYFFKQLCNNANKTLLKKYENENQNDTSNPLGIISSSCINIKSKENYKIDGVDNENVQVECNQLNQNTKEVTKVYQKYKKKKFAEVECQLCNKTFKTRNGYKQHLLTHSIEKYSKKAHKCENCSRLFVFKSALEKHMETHKEFTDVICDICKKNFKNYRSLKQHMLLHTHENSERKYKCEHCSKSFLIKSLLTKHMITHKQFADVECQMCHKMYKEQKALTKHILLMHQSDESLSRPHKCEYCYKSFKSKAALRQHKNTHKVVADIPCKICGKMFKTIQNLKQHLVIHSNDTSLKPFQCDHCSKAFPYKYYLARHIQIHKEAPDIKCKYCSKMFKTDKNLRYHVARHLKRKNSKK